MMTVNLKLLDLVEGTATNVDGITLFTEINKHLERGNIVRISLKGCGAFSSSFLNSSFGSLFDKYGITDVKTKVIFTDYLKSHERMLRDYYKIFAKFHSN